MTEGWGLWTGQSSLPVAGHKQILRGFRALQPPKQSTRKAGLPKGLGTQLWLKELPHTPTVELQPREVRPPTFLSGMLPCGPSAPQAQLVGGRGTCAGEEKLELPDVVVGARSPPESGYQRLCA